MRSLRRLRVVASVLMISLVGVFTSVLLSQQTGDVRFFSDNAWAIQARNRVIETELGQCVALEVDALLQVLVGQLADFMLAIMILRNLGEQQTCTSREASELPTQGLLCGFHGDTVHFKHDATGRTGATQWLGHPYPYPYEPQQASM